MSPQRGAIQRPPKQAPWDDQGAFRETMLVFFTDELIETALRPFGQLLYDLSLEAQPFQDRGADDTGRDLGAAAKELRHLHGFLREAGRDRVECDGDARVRELAQLARVLAREAREMAITIEKALAAAKPGRDQQATS